ncbi:hypothetical protein NMG60_11019748, partial [Bertholletia excelsa]
MVQRPWSDLPLDLLEEIMAWLSYADEICLRAVCKSWMTSPRESGVVDELPWLLTCSCSMEPLITGGRTCIKRKCTYDLFDPMHRLLVVASKYGWLFFSWEQKQPCADLKSFSLFSPFTNQIIEFEVYYYHFASFSHADTYSPDCQTRISTYRWGYEKWVSVLVDAPNILAWFDVLTGDFSILNPQYDPLLSWTGSYHLIDSEGDLRLVYTDNIWSLRKIFKFDWSFRSWVEQIGNSLTNRALFLGC